MKAKTRYLCQECAFASAKWLGRCPNCGGWNCFAEERVQEEPAVKANSLAALREDFRAIRSTQASAQDGPDDAALEGLPYRESAGIGLGGGGGWVSLEEDEDQTEGAAPKAPKKSAKPRIDTGVEELNRVLGGGLVPDSFILLGGDPGIGKSTLLLQVTRHLKERVFYVSGEESVDQIRDRARRLGVGSGRNVFLAAETQLERIFAMVKELKPQVLVVDSLQTVSSGFVESAPGSVSQVREVAARLMALAKSARVAVFLVGHVTKEGSIAGPKAVEHMVDTVLYFEGDGAQSYRLLRAVKNRFGNSRELGVFEMTGEGLAEVKNPSSLFLNDREDSVSGTAIAATIEGSRPILVEVQALVAQSPLAVPRRTSVGLDHSRVSLIAAIIERHMSVQMAQRDLFFNVAGGLRLAEPATDLAAAAAIWSSAVERVLPPDWVFIGEVGLTGEIRRVPLPEVRIAEAVKLGFKTVVLPQSAMERVRGSQGARLIPISRLA